MGKKIIGKYGKFTISADVTDITRIRITADIMRVGINDFVKTAVSEYIERRPELAAAVKAAMKASENIAADRKPGK